MPTSLLRHRLAAHPHVPGHAAYPVAQANPSYQLSPVQHVRPPACHGALPGGTIRDSMKMRSDAKLEVAPDRAKPAGPLSAKLVAYYPAKADKASMRRDVHRHAME